MAATRLAGVWPQKKAEGRISNDHRISLVRPNERPRAGLAGPSLGMMDTSFYTGQGMTWDLALCRLMIEAVQKWG